MMAIVPVATRRWETVLRHAGPFHSLHRAALAASVSLLLLSGCVTGKTAVDAIAEGVASEETEVPVDAASVVDPSAAPDPSSTPTAQAAAAAPPVSTQPPTTAPAQPMMGSQGPVVLEGTGLKAMSSSIFSTGTPAAGITPGAAGPTGGSLFRSQAEPAAPPQPQPMPEPQQSAVIPSPEPAAAPARPAAVPVSAATPIDPSASLIGLFGADRTRKANSDNQADRLELAANLSPQQVAALSYGALPGIRARSMFATVDDDAADHDDRSPEIKLAALSGLARLAPSGLLVQTETVETGCFKPQLLEILKGVEKRFGRKLIVTSGHRSLAHNIRVGGATRSRHLTCEAADIQVPGVTKWELANYLRSVPGRGGVGTYCHTQSVHVDIGRQRDWNWACRVRDA